jgi:GTP cyclohydrolase I
MSQKVSKEAQEEIFKGFSHILRGLSHMGYNASSFVCGEGDLDANFRGTAERATKGFLEMIHDEAIVEAAIEEMIQTDFPMEDPACGTEMLPSMKVSSANVVSGLCPHHLLPVLYRITVGYIPQERALGISKISRIISLVAGRPVLQEAIGVRLCDIFYRQLASRGAAAYVEGWHMCCAMRGTRHPESTYTTAEVCGAFKDNPETRSEFMQIIRMNHRGSLTP